MISLNISCCIDVSSVFISIIVDKYSIYIANEGKKQRITDGRWVFIIPAFLL
jgi:hypothetical protein